MSNPFLSRFERYLINTPFRVWDIKRKLRLISSEVQLPDDVYILSVGCGMGGEVEALFDILGAGRVDAFDLDPEQVRRAEKRLLNRYADRLKLSVGNVESIDAEDKTYDGVIALGVIHHTLDKEKAVSEISRVLKDGGVYLFEEPLKALTLNPIARLVADHPVQSQFTWEELLSIFKENGFIPQWFRHRWYEVYGVARKAG